MKAVLSLILILLVNYVSISQESKEVVFKWKIEVSDTLRYRTVMSEIDTSTLEYNILDIFPSSNDQSKEDLYRTNTLLKEIADFHNHNDFFSELTNSGDGIIDIIMTSVLKEPEAKKDSLSDFDKVMNLMKRNNKNAILLRGSVYESGGIHSFWLKNSQKNLISLLYELPSDSKKIGDTWELDVNLIANDQNFICETAKRTNMVTIVDIRQEKDETIALLSYDIEEFVSGIFSSSYGASSGKRTVMKMTYNGVAEFSIDKGKWLEFEGVMGIDSQGIMNSKSQKKFSLTEDIK